MTLNGRRPIVIKRSLVRTNLHRAALLVMALGLLPQASFAHNTACGSSTITDKYVSSDIVWSTLRSCQLDLSDGDHKCVVYACADLENPFGTNTENRYRFVVSVSPGLGQYIGNDTGHERAVELTSNEGINDPGTEAVCTVGQFSLDAYYLPYTFMSLARKFDTDTDTTLVRDSSLAVVCLDSQ